MRRYEKEREREMVGFMRYNYIIRSMLYSFAIRPKYKMELRNWIPPHRTVSRPFVSGYSGFVECMKDFALHSNLLSHCSALAVHGRMNGVSAARHVLVSYMYAHMSTTTYNHNRYDHAANERESGGPVGILLVRSPPTPPVSLAYPVVPKRHTR